jgi:hypothetical protein
MNIKIFMASASDLAEKNRLRALGSGIQDWIDKNITDNDRHLDVVRIGRWNQFKERPQHTLEYEYGEAYRPCDLAVIFGSWKPREKGTHQTRTSVAHNAPQFLVIETPLLNRHTDRINQYWRIGINGYLNRDAVWAQLRPTQADQRLQELGIKWNGWHNDTQGHIVIALQLPGDASLRGQDINEWAFDTVQRLRTVCDRPIVVRCHPLVSDRGFQDHNELAGKILMAGIDHIRFSDGAVVPWSQDLNGAYCTVTYTSGMAIDSVMAGIPTIACDEGNFAWGISSNEIEEVRDVRRASRSEIEQWLRFLSGCQWNIDEMRNGTAWQHLLRTLEPSSESD